MKSGYYWVKINKCSAWDVMYYESCYECFYNVEGESFYHYELYEDIIFIPPPEHL